MIVFIISLMYYYLFIPSLRIHPDASQQRIRAASPPIRSGRIPCDTLPRQWSCDNDSRILELRVLIG